MQEASLLYRDRGMAGLSDFSLARVSRLSGRSVRALNPGRRVFFRRGGGARGRKDEKQPEKTAVDGAAPPSGGERAGAGGALAEISEERAEDDTEEERPVRSKIYELHFLNNSKWLNQEC